MDKNWADDHIAGLCEVDKVEARIARQKKIDREKFIKDLFSILGNMLVISAVLFVVAFGLITLFM